jgi:hypothetical protein
LGGFDSWTECEIVSYVNSSDQELVYEFNRVNAELRGKVHAARICGMTKQQVLDLASDASAEADRMFGDLIGEAERRIAALNGRNPHLRVVPPGTLQRPASDGFGQRAA